jgi:hypothetical protein
MVDKSIFVKIVVVAVFANMVAKSAIVQMKIAEETTVANTVI